MNTQWQLFLIQEGAVIQEGTVLDFGKPAEECARVVQSNVIADLSHEGLICVTGADAAHFLQGQLTCDVQEITPETSRLGAWCTAKGRVRITFRLFQSEGEWCLALPAACVENTLQTLRKYVLRSKVTLRNASEERIHLGCSGPGIEEALRCVFPVLPAAPDQVTHAGSSTILRIRNVPVPCFELWGERDALSRVWETVQTDGSAVGAKAWSTLQVLAGVPVITPPLAEVFVPHMINLPELGAVHFRKGCYAGQEIVARTQYLGKSKRRLHLAWVAANEPPLVGETLWTPPTEEHPGQIVNAAPAPEGGFLVLAVMATADFTKGNVRLRDQNGPLLEPRTLPYPVVF